MSGRWLLALWGAQAALCAQEADLFVRKLYPVFEAAQCRRCHNDNGVAAATRLHFPPDDATPAQILDFGLRLVVLVDRAQPDQSLLLRKPTRRIPHTGGERIHPGSPEERALENWIAYLARLPEDRVAALRRAAAPSALAEAPVLRRLTNAQYNNTVRDLLGDETHPADQFPEEDYVHGFTNQAEGQSVSPLLAEAYNHAAERLAKAAFLGGDLHRLVPCDPASATDPACRQRFIREFGRKAFRRPLTVQEEHRYDKLFLLEADRANLFRAGARIVVEAMLQSPSFLFYAGTAPDSASQAYELASRLSYFLWNTTPPDWLLRSTASGDLSSPAGAARASARMLDDPRARMAMDEFLAEWLRFDRLRAAIRDRRLYPEFSAELVYAMSEESRRLFEHLVWGDRDFMEFFTAPYAFVNADLARLYGLAPPEKEFEPVAFSPGSQRAGVLGEATFLTLTSKPAETSPTERGIFIRQQFLCQIIPPPPPGVNTNLPPISDEKPLTNRQRMAMHLASPACAACHRLIDQVGFGFEQYDAIGRFREKQQVTIFPTLDQMQHRTKLIPSHYQLAIDTAATVRGLPDSDFASPLELGRILAASPICQRCVVKQLFRYAMGRPETGADQPAIDAALDAFRKSHFHFRDLIIAIVASKPFLGG